MRNDNINTFGAVETVVTGRAGLGRGSQPQGIADLSCGAYDGFRHAEVGADVAYRAGDTLSLSFLRLEGGKEEEG